MGHSAQTSGENHNAVVAAAWIGGTAVGWLLGGGVAAVLLGVATPAAVAIVLGARRARRFGAALDAPVPDVSALPGRQALAALAAATRDAANFDSPQLRALEKLDDDSGGDPHRALALAEELMAEHRRSPLVTAEVARRHAAVGNTVQAQRHAGLSITLALDGGMNPMAAKLLAEFRAHRESFELSAAHRRRLAGAATANDDDSGAAWCREEGS